MERISRRWSLDCTLARDLVRLDGFGLAGWSKLRAAAPLWLRGSPLSAFLIWPGLYVISGYRTEEQQAGLNPGAQDSQHRRCPSLAADLRVGQLEACLTAPAVWQWLAAGWKLQGPGHRWGGDFIGGFVPCPLWEADLNHFDLSA